MHNTKLRKGFTLIELLIVIAIIGVLAGAVVISLGDETNKAQKATTKLNVRSVATEAQIDAANQTRTGATLCADGVAAGNSSVTAVAVGDADDLTDTNELAVTDVGAIVCVSREEEWVIIGRTSATEGWCVDSAGANQVITNANIADTDIADSVGNVKCK